MVKLTLFQAGYCTAPEHILQRGGRRVEVKLPALFALIEHPQVGYVLFDTGYSRRFYEETARGLNWLYGKITPVTVQEEDEAQAQLAARGIRVNEIGHVLISHFHADHVGALRDFPKATFHYLAEGWAAVKGKRGFGAVRQAFLPGLMPPDFEARGLGLSASHHHALPPELAPFIHGVDLFGDETVWAVPLPGHAIGQMGIVVRAETGLYFLVADAAWQSIAYQAYKLPSPLAYLLFPYPQLYDLTLKQIHGVWQRQSGVHIIPSHCETAAQRYGSVSPK
jgi:glyoxylase-like metal-dependent hydrolase (beta-lactamase superfamily II)